MSPIEVYKYQGPCAELSLPQINVWVARLILKSECDDQDHGTLGGDRDSSAVQLKSKTKQAGAGSGLEQDQRPTRFGPSSEPRAPNIDAVDLARKVSLNAYTRKVKNPST
jgi:hypothetical protein